MYVGISTTTDWGTTPVHLYHVRSRLLSDAVPPVTMIFNLFHDIISEAEVAYLDLHMAESMAGVLRVTPSLTITDVARILENPPGTIITAPPVKPKAGQVYLYKAADSTKQGKMATQKKIN